MRHWRHSGRALSLVGSVLVLAACGGDDDGGGAGSGRGTVTVEWASFCTGTFTKDTAILDPFDDPVFTARAGEEYLLANFDDSFGGRAEFLYLTKDGPDSFEVKRDASGAWPFTSNCAIGEGVPYYAVFKDVSVYAEQELTTKLCDLQAGRVLPAAGSARGYALAGSIGETVVYEVLLGPFSTECGGQPRGYVRVPQTRSFGAITWLVPIAGIIGPQ